MVALGPRVGGAHVTVSAKADMRSFDDVAQRIHQQLASIGAQQTKVYRSIGREAVTAWRAALGSILAGAPLIGSAMSAAAGAVTTLAGAIYSLGQTSYAALPFFTSLGLAGLTLSVGMRNFSAAVSETNPKALQELLKGMPKSMQEAVLSTRALSDEMRAAIWPKLFAGLSDGIDSLRNTGVIQRGLGLMAESLNGLARSVLNYANTKDGISTIDRFLQNNAKVFKELSKAAVPFLDGFLRLVNALTPAALRLADRITDVATRFQEWTRAEGFGTRINDMMKRAEKTAGKLFDIFGNLYTAFINIFNAANPATNTFLDMLIRVTDRFAKFTGSVDGQKSIADWAMSSVDVMKQFGETIRAVFDVVKELADPRVIVSFLKTVEGAFLIIADLPLAKMVDIFVQIAEKIQPISSAFLAVIAGGAAVSIMIGSLAGQLGGVFGVFSRFKKVGDIFKNLGKGAGPAGKDVGKLTGILKGVGTVLGKALRFAGLVGLGVYIGTLINKSDKLKAKMKDAFQAFKDLATPLTDAFDKIKTSLEPAGKALKPVFEFLDKIATLGIALILDTIVFAFESLGKAIEGAGTIISGVIDFFTALFQLDGSAMLDSLKKIGSGIGPLLKGLGGLFITFFAPAKFIALAGVAFKGMLGGMARAVPGILGFVGKFLLNVLRFIGTLPKKLLILGGRALTYLGFGIIKFTPKVLSAAGKATKGIIGWIARLPGRLLQLGAQAIIRLGFAIQKYTPIVLSAAGRIFTGVLNWIKKLPERLPGLAKTAVSKLGGALRDGVGKVKDAAGAIFGAIWNGVKGLPGDLLKLGGAMIGGLVDGVLGKLGDLKDAAGKIGGAIKGFLPGSPVKEGPLTSWNYGGGASGGGRNVIDAITGGLKDTDPIRKAMAGVADAVASSIVPRVAIARAGAAEPRRVATDTRRASDDTGGNVYIAKMMPHNYGEFEKQTREKQRLASLGGRPS